MNVPTITAGRREVARRRTRPTRAAETAVADEQPATERRVASILAAVAATQAVGGAALWLTLITGAGPARAATVGAILATTQLGGLLGGAGLPLAVSHFRSHPQHHAITRASAATTATGSAFALAALTHLAIPDLDTAAGLAVIGLGAAAATSVVADAHLGAAHRWAHLLLRTAVSTALRVVLVGGVLATNAPTMALAAALLAPDAMTSLVTLRPLIRPARTRTQHLTAEVRRFAGAQYSSTMLLLGPSLAVPVVCGPLLDVEAQAAFYPAWSLLAITATIVSSAAGAPLLLDHLDAPGRRRATVAPFLAIAAAGAAALAASGVIVLPDRLSSVATAGALFLAANLFWPWLTRSLTLLRRGDRNRATVAVTALWATTAFGTTWWWRTDLTIGRIALAWALSGTIAATVAHQLRRRQP